MGLAKHSHIAARGYLRAWTENGVLGVGWVNSEGPARLPPSEVAVRSRFYLDQDLDGSANDWFETQMGRVESGALSVLRRMETDWPTETAARARLAEFLGLQYLRSPAYRQWHADAVRIAGEEIRREGTDHTEESLAAAEAILATDRERHLTMASQLPLAGTIFANMHWTLLRTGSPRLATSDHPLVPVAVGENQPVSPIPSGGVMGTAEVRFAVYPRLLLLLTWQDDYGPEPVLKMRHDLVRNHNTLVIAQAEEQWFHHPSRRAEHGRSGSWPSIVSRLPRMHGVTPVETRRHNVVMQVANEVLDTEGEERNGIRTIDWPSVRRQTA
jgi:hypothetical protein